jgi:hypothetical protein
MSHNIKLEIRQTRVDLKEVKNTKKNKIKSHFKLILLLIDNDNQSQFFPKFSIYWSNWYTSACLSMVIHLPNQDIFIRFLRI